MLDNQPIIMVRGDLENIPAYPLPDGYHFKWYQPGDEKWWLDIHFKADQYNEVSLELFQQSFGNDPAILNLRQVYLLASQGQFVGTSTAWYNNNFEGLPYGRVHWVAIIPEFQGLGLANSLLELTCRRLKALGHQQAYLTTSSARTAAIRLYEKFGFRMKR